MSRETSAPALKTRTVLIAAMTVIVALVTTSSLLIVRQQMRRSIQADVAANLARSVEAFQHLQTDRLASQRRTGALLADLPSLKALMTTGDRRTIQDGAQEFWRTSDSDLFALASASGEIAALFTRSGVATPELTASLQQLLIAPNHYDIVQGDRLFSVAVHPLYFGSEAAGTLLGYVLTGFAIDAPFVQQLSAASGVEVTFVSGKAVLATSLPTPLRAGLPAAIGATSSLTPLEAKSTERVRSVRLGSDRYLTATQNLSATANAPLQIVLMQSLSGAEGALRGINALVLLVGVLATLAGGALMTVLARAVTHPLEVLATEVGAFGHGDAAFNTPPAGTTEIRELSHAFRSMRDQIAASHAALLQAERLATIGRMASSVSHDLRHYLAAVYANAEFLAAPGISDEERKDLFMDIRSAVLGTTELMDSLLLFSRPEQRDHPAPMQPIALAEVVRGALALVEAHPDGAGVILSQTWAGPWDAMVRMNPRQVERALFNLLLNACQADRAANLPRRVFLETIVLPDAVTLSVTDNGLGVPENVRGNLFEAFVSEGKQKGTGLGLTLVQAVASEHGGSIRLVPGRPEETIFELRLPRSSAHVDRKAQQRSMDRAEAQ